MKRIAYTILFVFIHFLCSAQSDRVVKGTVIGENGIVISGAEVRAVGQGLYSKTDSDGKFVIKIPQSVEELQVVSPGYHTLTLKITESFMIFNLKLDKEYASRAYDYAVIEAKLAEAAEKKVIEEAKEKENAERIARLKELNASYDKEYKNKGFDCSVEILYGYQLGHGDVKYRNMGFREYGSLHPVEANFTLGYRFSNWFSAGVGAGVQYQLVNLSEYKHGDLIDPVYLGWERFTRMNFPLFINVKSYLSRGKIQPLLSLSGGIYLPNNEGMFDIGLGTNLRLNKTKNLYFLLSFRVTPYGDFREIDTIVNRADVIEKDYKAYYDKLVWTPSFKIGVTL